jgi:hypothetical protein
MDFIWNDGGRASSGFVGLTGDCVPRAIAIATGIAYREVYEKLGSASDKSPRFGVRTDVAHAFLSERGWIRSQGLEQPFAMHSLVHIARYDRSHHFCTLIDHVMHDTWDASEDDDYTVIDYWTCPSHSSRERAPFSEADSNAADLTQVEFDRILDRLRKLDRTASNSASTEGEKHNALRMMQSLMLRHNLTRSDIVDDSGLENVQFTRMACPINGRRACAWEKSLAYYVCQVILPTTQWFICTSRSRTLFWFYGPRADVQNAIALFRELLLTIASSAQLQFGGYSRGSGASYAEGYVEGLPRSNEPSPTDRREEVVERALIQHRTLSLQAAASQWLDHECNVQIKIRYSFGRDQYDGNAANRGRVDGSLHEIVVPKATLRIGPK